MDFGEKENVYFVPLRDFGKFLKERIFSDPKIGPPPVLLEIFDEQEEAIMSSAKETLETCEYEGQEGLNFTQTTLRKFFLKLTKNILLSGLKKKIDDGKVMLSVDEDGNFVFFTRPEIL